MNLHKTNELELLEREVALIDKQLELKGQELEGMEGEARG